MNYLPWANKDTFAIVNDGTIERTFYAAITSLLVVDSKWNAKLGQKSKQILAGELMGRRWRRTPIWVECKTCILISFGNLVAQ